MSNTTPNKAYSKINLFIRSLLFSLYMITSICLYSFVILFTIVLPLRIRHIVIRQYMVCYFVVLKFLCHIDYTIEGLENIPKDQVGIIMCKHQSTWETFLLPVYFRAPAAIAKRELAFVPFFGWALAISAPIFINRSEKKSAMAQVIEKGRKWLQAGRWIMVFPEGTRVPYGTVGNYKLGGARLAVETGYPIIPVAHNAGKFWPRRKFIKQPGTISVVIGPMIASQGRTPEDLLAETKDWIESTVAKL